MQLKSYLLASLALGLACRAELDGRRARTGEQASSQVAEEADVGVEKPFPFEPVAPEVYVAKVKGLLTGLPPSADEVQAVKTEPGALRRMIDAWFVSPEAQLKLLAFYGSVFQQNQLKVGQLQNQLPFIGALTTPNANAILDAVQSSFPLTVKDIVARRRSFTETVETSAYHMNTLLALLHVYASDHVDSDREDDLALQDHPVSGGALPELCLVHHGPTDATQARNGVRPEVDVPANAVPQAQWLDPSSKNFLQIESPVPHTCDMPALDPAGVVKRDPKTNKALRETRTYNYVCASKGKGQSDLALLFMLLGQVPGGNLLATSDAFRAPPVPESDKQRAIDYQVRCGVQYPEAFKAFAVTASDNTDWRSVAMLPRDGVPASRVPFWDLARLRRTQELQLSTPRVGFMNTLAFLANWPTNPSNDARVALNQTLIVGLGKSINPVDQGATTVLDTGKDGEHSDPTSPCYSCHQAMDPMREVFRRTFTYRYSTQNDPLQIFKQPRFDFFGVSAQISTFSEFARTITGHPLYATALVQKLCYYANSAACSEDDPEFLRVAQSFRDSRHDFQSLVRELFSSPLVTGASETQTWTDRGEVVSIARYNHFCFGLTKRLDLGCDICGQVQRAPGACDGKVSAAQASVRNNVPSDGFVRGAEGPVLSTDPTLFFRASVENACGLAADAVIDVKDSAYQSTKLELSLDQITRIVVGLAENDPARAVVRGILREHYDAALAAGASAKEALRSSFILGCTSPTSTAVGL